MATAIPENAASFLLSELASSCAGVIDPSHAGLRVRGVTTDSRKAASGTLFVALRGEHHDGHAYLRDAQQMGAAAVVVSDASAVPAGLPALLVADTRKALGEIARLHRVRWGGKVVAITGSAGKTTTKELTAAALERLGRRVLRTQGNLNNDIGLPMTLLGLSHVHDAAVVELGTSAPGEIAWLAHVAQADVGVVTTVSLAHTEGLGTLDGVADEKCALLHSLSKSGVAIYGADSEPLRARIDSFGAQRLISFGEHASATVRLERHALKADLTTRCSYRVASRELPVELTLGLCGQGPALDAGAALSAVLALHDADALDEAAAGLRNVSAVPGRLAPRPGLRESLIVDDSYNANPASMRASLHTVIELARVRRGRALLVLGDMGELGEHTVAEHERLGRMAVELGAALLVGCGAHMAHAVSAATQAAAAASTPSALRIEHCPEPLSAIALVQAVLAPGDAVLVKGSRSMAMERVVQALAEPQPPQGGRA